MSDKDLFKKNLELSSELSRFVLSNPDFAKRLPQDAEILFIVDTDIQLSQANIKLANKIQAEGGKVIFVHVKDVLPKEASRLVNPRIELTANK